MGAEVVQFKPTPHPDWAINPDTFPSDCDTARALGVLMTWHGPGVIIKPLAFSSSACDLIVYSRRGLAAWRVAALTGLPQALVEAFNEGFNKGLRSMDGGQVALLTGQGEQSGEVVLAGYGGVGFYPFSASSPPAASTGMNTAARR
jgi:hypothetical protein